MRRDPTRMVESLRLQAAACGSLGSPLYADLLARVADDVTAQGLFANVLEGHEHDPGSDALALRLMGSVHRLALDGRAPELARHYPSTGGRPGSPEDVWVAFRSVASRHTDDVLAGLQTPPQTNEVGRSAALLGGLLRLAATYRLPIRLHEIGASGGLNLRADAFRYESAGTPVWGPPDSPVVLPDAWRGPLPPLDARLSVVERVGYDVAPVDVTTGEGRLVLMAYVWPDQVERLARLRAALTVAESVPADLRRASAAEAVSGLRLATGTTTVVWHSVMWQYLAGAEQAAVSARLVELGAQATPRAPFAHLCLEPRRVGRDLEFRVVLRRWPGGGRERLLATAAPHGLPTTWRNGDPMR